MIRTITAPALISAAALLGASPSARALPVWVVTNATFELAGETYANERSNDGTPQDLLGLGDRDLGGVNGLIAGLFGYSYANRLQVRSSDWNFLSSPQAFTSSTVVGRGTIDGDGSQEIVVSWFIVADCQAFAPDSFEGTSELKMGTPPTIAFEVELDTAGVPPGTPLIIYTSWDASSRGFSDFELPQGGLPPDRSEVSGTQLSIDGVEQLQGRFNFSMVPPFRSIAYTLKDQAGTMNISAGTKIKLRVRGQVNSEIYAKGRGVYDAEDQAWAVFEGRIRLSTGTPPLPGPPGGLANLVNAIPDFSLDIGSDCELSEPLATPGVFDPGDVYAWFGPALPPGGANGYRNDLDACLADPPPMIGPVAPAPICTGLAISSVASQWFDLDGHDEIDFPVEQLLAHPGPLPSPQPAFASTCIFGADYLLVSFEDDDADPYTSCAIPVASLSPFAIEPRGTNAAQDEVWGVTIVPIYPAPVINEYPIAEESGVHVSLAPNPNGGAEFFDDDVDSLDIPIDAAACSNVYFSADHEATFVDLGSAAQPPLDPGAIYKAVAGAPPQLVIDPVIHLGLFPGVDVGDFEFVFFEDFIAGNSSALALLFCVHADDPQTAVDESGGLNPRQVYISFLTGSSFPLLTGQLRDRVDALASWKQDLSVPAPPAPICCVGNADKVTPGAVSFADITAVLANFGTLYPPPTTGPGDADCNSSVTFADVTAVLANFGKLCP